MNRAARRAAGKSQAVPGSRDRCPSCKSHSVLPVPQNVTGFYDREVIACRNCKAIWEPLPPGEPWCAEEPLNAFREPCANCAFRPGSPEQEDRERWTKLIEQLATGASFYCHRGVPIDPKGEHGFKYPTGPDGKPDRKKLRLCRGYLNMLGRQWDKALKPETRQDA